MDINSLKTGDILAFSDHSALGLLVRLFTFSKFVHVGMIYDNMVLEAIRDGVVLSPIPEVLNRKGSIYHCSLLPIEHRITLKNIDLLDNFVKAEDPKPYDLKGAVMLGLDNVFQVFGKAATPDKRFCSELVIEARKALGLMDKRIKSASWSPADVVKNIRYTNIKKIV